MNCCLDFRDPLDYLSPLDPLTSFQGFLDQYFLGFLDHQFPLYLPPGSSRLAGSIIQLDSSRV